MSRTPADFPADPLEARTRSALESPAPPEDWADMVRELLEGYLAQRRLLDRLTRIADRYQAAARESSRTSLRDYERKLHRLEKIVRISDQYQRVLHELKQKLEHSSNHDALTGLPNRRYMVRRQEEAASLAARHPEASYGLLIADLDHFKSVNDEFGHSAGDVVLQAVAQALQSPLREYDLLARWGGEEFLFLLPSTSLEGASAMAERLRMALADAPQIHGGIPAPTVSIGYTAHLPGESVDETLRRADRALYEAKSRGRNCAVGA
ncbi:MAG: diguanylate cyclase [Thermodesulfobacteriota bacterium]